MIGRLFLLLSASAVRARTRFRKAHLPADESSTHTCTFTRAQRGRANLLPKHACGSTCAQMQSMGHTCACVHTHARMRLNGGQACPPEVTTTATSYDRFTVRVVDLGPVA